MSRPRTTGVQVKVAVAHSSDGYGSVYPTYGFIYDRPDDRVLLADAGRAGAQTEVDEVAELPDNATPRFAYRIAALAPSSPAPYHD